MKNIRNSLMLALAVAAGAPASNAVARGFDPDSVSTYVQVDNGKTVSVKMRNGKIESASIDGKAIPEDRIQRDGGTLKLLDAHGKVLATVDIGQDQNDEDERDDQAEAGQGHAKAAREHAQRLRESAAEMAQRGRELADEIRARVKAPGGDRVIVRGSDAAPKTMLGVTPESPSEALAAQLGVDEEKTTVLAGVAKDLAADKAGLKKFDVITSIDGQDDANPSALRKVLREKNPGDSIKLKIIRGGQKQEIMVALEKFDAEKLGEAGVMAFDPEDFDQHFEGLAKSFEGMGEQFKQLAPRAGEPRTFRMRVPRPGAEIPAPPAPPAAPGAPMILMDQMGSSKASKERLDRMDERLKRIEEMLSKLQDKKTP